MLATVGVENEAAEVAAGAEDEATVEALGLTEGDDVGGFEGGAGRAEQVEEPGFAGCAEGGRGRRWSGMGWLSVDPGAPVKAEGGGFAKAGRTGGDGRDGRAGRDG